MATTILALYGAFGVWATVLGYSLLNNSYKWFAACGLILMTMLNTAYFFRGQADSIALFLSVYDVPDNLGLSFSNATTLTELPVGLTTCANNTCTTWGDTYTTHPTWAVAFYNRFATEAPPGDYRKAFLYVHIAMNSIAFLLAHWQLFNPGTDKTKALLHRYLGRIGFFAVTIGTLCGVLLCSQHGSVDEYGGIYSKLGFYSMSFIVYTTAIKTVTTARAGDIASHKIWMFRYLGSMWGSFWLFRVMILVTGPLLRSFSHSAALQISIWCSAPFGVLIAERFRSTALATTTGGKEHKKE